MNIKAELNLIKEVVDNAMHVMIDEDEIFSFAKCNYENMIACKDCDVNFENVKKKLFELNIVKTNNPLAHDEIDASCKLAVYLIACEYDDLTCDKVLSYLSMR